MSRRIAGLWLLWWTALALRTDSDSNDEDRYRKGLVIWVYTLNLGKLSKPENRAGLEDMVDNVLAKARDQHVKLVSVNFQEAPSEKTFFIRPVTGWRVIRTRHLCNEQLHAIQIKCDFALFSYLYIADYRTERQMPVDGDIRGVRTLLFTQKQLRQLQSTDTVDDKYAEGCGAGKESTELPATYWGGVLHDDALRPDMEVIKAARRCHGVAVMHEDYLGVAAKATLITRYRVHHVLGGANHQMDFIVSTSHLGVIPNAKDMFRMSERSQELGQAMDALKVVSDNYTVPTFMTGDWNFRMVPFDSLAEFSNFTGLDYTGPVLHLVNGSVRSAWVTRSPMRPGVAYEEMRVAAVALQPQYISKMRWLQSLNPGLNWLYQHFTTVWKRAPTCRFQESHNRAPASTIPFVVLENYASEEVLPSADFLSLDGGKWELFKEEGFDLTKAQGRKGTPEESLVTRLPSYCDQIFWSKGIYKISMGTAWSVLGDSLRAMMQSDHNMLELKAVLGL
mmetsp:Transcript_24488/g.57642  ORF Transcript_24488/g.57642 Transcript_24488/m.57642 type:complete len:506 (+) Transcript_24488:27-1544(+)|eukprot:s767_g11.t1